jgi:hypothetical protein
MPRIGLGGRLRIGWTFGGRVEGDGAGAAA